MPAFFHLHLVFGLDRRDADHGLPVRLALNTSMRRRSKHVYPAVRTNKQLDRVLAEIETSPGVILYTLLDQSLIGRLEDKCRELGLPCLSILGPVLSLFQSYLGAESTHKVGGAAHLECGLFQADRRAQLHHDA